MLVETGLCRLKRLSVLFTGVSLESVRVLVWGLLAVSSCLVLSCPCSVMTMAAAMGSKAGIDWVGRFAVTDSYCDYRPTEHVRASCLLTGTCTMPATISKSEQIPLRSCTCCCAYLYRQIIHAP